MRFFFVLTSTLIITVNCFAQQNYLSILKRAGYHENDTLKNKPLPQFTYQSPNDSNLVTFRKVYKLDSIAGFGNEASRAINLLHYVHNTVKHNGQVESGIKDINGPAIIHAACTRGVGVSCGELATVLNDCFLAMGIPSHKVYCFPKDSLHTDHDSHVINTAYISSLKKWIWLDPTNDAYVMDDNGNLLGIEEVRERLISDKPLIVNPDANWNHRVSVVKADYLYNYMAKNLYRLYTPLESRFNYETQGKNNKRAYVYLLPGEMNPNNYNLPYYNDNNKITYLNSAVSDADKFWQVPGNFTK